MCYVVELPDGSYYVPNGSVPDACKAIHFTDKDEATAIAKAKKGKVKVCTLKDVAPPPKDNSQLWVMGLIFIGIATFRDPTNLEILQRITRLDQPSNGVTAGTVQFTSSWSDCLWF